jgi:hypothetical protein
VSEPIKIDPFWILLNVDKATGKVVFSVSLIVKTLYGLVVPIPTLPLFDTTKLVAVDEPITKAGPVIPFGFIDNCPKGVVLPIPSFPDTYPVVIFGSNQNTAVELELLPIATISVLLFE